MKTSENTSNIFKALSAVQGAIKNPAKTSTNPAFKSKYSPLDEILCDANRKLLSDNGLFLSQWVTGTGDTVSVYTMISHASGEYVEYDPLTLKLEKATAQGAGSAITYARRYTVASILGVASDEDDDGNGAQPKPGKREEVDPKVKRLVDIAEAHQITHKQLLGVILRDYKKTTIESLSEAEYQEVEAKILTPKQPKTNS